MHFQLEIVDIAEIIDWLRRAYQLHDLWRFVGLASLVCVFVVGGLWAAGIDVSND